MIFKDYYKILGLENNKVTPEEIKTAYREQAKKYHPDINSQNDFSEERFKDINEAYRVLSAPASRRKYDRMWNSNVGKKKKFEESKREEGSIFSNFFKMFFGEQIEKEILELHQTVYEKYNYEMTELRPPMGEFSEKSLAVTNNLGYRTVMWSFAYKDWEEKNQPNEKEAIELITKNFHSGEIMLLHANSSTNTKILSEIIKQAREQGYVFESLKNFEE